MKILLMLCVFLSVFYYVNIHDKNIPNSEPNIIEQEHDIDIEKLEEEYILMIETIESILFLTTEEELDYETAFNIFNYIGEIKIEPTQPQTKSIDEKIDTILELGIKYYSNNDNEYRTEIRDDIINTLNEIEEIMIEIDLLLDYNEI